jgi:hypothetical protein
MNGEHPEAADAVDFMFQFPHDKVGLIIGKKGATFHQFQDESGSTVFGSRVQLR